MYQISEAELENAVHSSVERLLADKINWEHAFGVTERRNGEVVSGNPRDTIDTGKTIEGISVSVSSEQIVITFENDEAESIFHYRNEIDELVTNSVVAELAIDLTEFVLGKVLR
jgi:hypothetical protein